jgi:hypothetical protein
VYCLSWLIFLERKTKKKLDYLFTILQHQPIINQ